MVGFLPRGLITYMPETAGMRHVDRVLVLGSNAFTAGHFTDYLLRHTDCQVLGLSRSPEYAPLFLPYLYRQSRPARFRFEQVDLNRDDYQELVRAFRPQAVVNYAAQGEVRNSWLHPEQWYRTNCLAVVQVAEFLRTLDGLECYVSVSTPEVYGTTGERVKENETYRPSTPYAVSKLAGDLHLGAMHRRYGFPVVYTRAANLYGIHQQLYRIIPRTALYLKLGRTLELHGRGRARRAFIHAQDVAQATWRAIQVGRLGEVYHLAPPEEPQSIAWLVETICQKMGYDFEGAVRMVDENFGQDELFSMDASKAERELDWRCQVSLEEGIDETVRWVEENFDELVRTPLDYEYKP